MATSSKSDYFKPKILIPSSFIWHFSSERQIYLSFRASGSFSSIYMNSDFSFTFRFLLIPDVNTLLYNVRLKHVEIRELKDKRKRISPADEPYLKGSDIIIVHIVGAKVLNQSNCVIIGVFYGFTKYLFFMIWDYLVPVTETG